MKQENKYYVPDLTEFHIGFECEIYDEDDKTWDLVYVDTQPALCNITGLDLQIRVKYLDREDIESLGFKYQDGKMIKNYSDNFIYKKNENLQYNLKYVYKQNILRIDVEDLVYFEESYNYLFQGIIKNKSELKKLLKQLNIT